MKKRFLKLKIAMTNISRIIMSFLFVNVGYLFQNSVQAVKNPNYKLTPADLTGQEPSCYIAGLPRFELNVFIISVPIVLVIALVLFIIVKKKKSKKKKEEEKEKMTNQGEKDV